MTFVKKKKNNNKKQQIKQKTIKYKKQTKTPDTEKTH